MFISVSKTPSPSLGLKARCTNEWGIKEHKFKASKRHQDEVEQKTLEISSDPDKKPRPKDV